MFWPNHTSRLFSWAALASLACIVFGLHACVSRKYNSDALPETITAQAQPRIAVDYLGMGWCYYLEDPSHTPEVFKTDLIDDEIDVDIATGIETNYQFQVVYTLRKFKNTHTVSMDFDSLSEWQRKNMSLFSSSADEWESFMKLADEISRARTAVLGRRLDAGLCRTIYKDKKVPDYNLLKAHRFKSTSMSEYVVRCFGDTGELVSRSEAQFVPVANYRVIRKALNEVTTSPEYARFQKSGAKCRENVLQLEIGRGRILQVIKKKVL